MAEKKDIKEGAYFQTAVGRIGKAYAVTNKKKEEGIVDLFFKDEGCIVEGVNYAQPSGMFRVETLTKVGKPKKTK